MAAILVKPRQRGGRSFIPTMEGLRAHDTMNECGRRNDSYSLEWIKDEQFGVARHNEVGMTVHSQLKKLVVIRITASNDSLGNHHQLSFL